MRWSGPSWTSRVPDYKSMDGPVDNRADSLPHLNNWASLLSRSRACKHPSASSSLVEIESREDRMQRDLISDGCNQLANGENRLGSSGTHELCYPFMPGSSFGQITSRREVLHKRDLILVQFEVEMIKGALNPLNFLIVNRILRKMNRGTKQSICSWISYNIVCARHDLMPCMSACA